MGNSCGASYIKRPPSSPSDQRTHSQDISKRGVNILPSSGTSSNPSGTSSNPSDSKLSNQSQGQGQAGHISDSKLSKEQNKGQIQLQIQNGGRILLNRQDIDSNPRSSSIQSSIRPVTIPEGLIKSELSRKNLGYAQEIKEQGQKNVHEQSDDSIFEKLRKIHSQNIKVGKNRQQLFKKTGISNPPRLSLRIKVQKILEVQQ